MKVPGNRTWQEPKVLRVDAGAVHADKGGPDKFVDPSHHQPPSSHKGPLDASDSQKPAEIVLEVWPLCGCWQDVQPSQELALGAPLTALCTPLQPWLWEPLLLGCQLHVRCMAQPCTVLWWGRQERAPCQPQPRAARGLGSGWRLPGPCHQADGGAMGRERLG